MVLWHLATSRDQRPKSAKWSSSRNQLISGATPSAQFLPPKRVGQRGSQLSMPHYAWPNCHQLPGHSAQPSMARDVYGSLLRIGIVFVSLRRLSGEVRHQNSNAVNSKWYASSLPGLQVFHAKCSWSLKHKNDLRLASPPESEWSLGQKMGHSTESLLCEVTAFLVPLATKICHGNMFTTFVSYVGLTWFNYMLHVFLCFWARHLKISSSERAVTCAEEI